MKIHMMYRMLDQCNFREQMRTAFVAFLFQCEERSRLRYVPMINVTTD
jgi:hypothetical protein